MGRRRDHMRIGVSALCHARTVSGGEHYCVGMEPDHKPSVISRLLREVSWEGRNVNRYRDGGRGMENALTVEVFQGTSNLPRNLFLREVLRCAHDAEQTRFAAADEVERADLDVLPGSLLPPSG